MSREISTEWDPIQAAAALPWDARVVALAEGLIASARIAGTSAGDAIGAESIAARRAQVNLAQALMDACIDACRAFAEAQAAENRTTTGAKNARARSIVSRVMSPVRTAKREACARRVRAVLTATASAWGALPVRERGVLATVARGWWGNAVTALATDSRAIVRLSVALLAAEAMEAELALVACGLMSDEDGSVVDAAERALVILAVGVAKGHTEDLSGAVVHAVSLAAEGFGVHQRRGVMLAVVALFEPARLTHAMRSGVLEGASQESRECATALRRLFVKESAEMSRVGKDARASVVRVKESELRREEANESIEALRSVLRLSNSSHASKRAVEWLSREVLTKACADRLGRGRTRADHAALLEGAHLLEHPARARGLARIVLPTLRAAKDGAGSVLPMDVGIGTGVGVGVGVGIGMGGNEAWPEDLRAQVPRVAMHLRASDADLSAWLAPLLGDPSSRVRLALAIRGPAGLRADLCQDAHPLVARAAAIRASEAGTLTEGRHTRDQTSGQSRGEIEAARGGSALMPSKALARSQSATVRAISQADGSLAGSRGVAMRLAWHRRGVRDIDGVKSELASMILGKASVWQSSADTNSNCDIETGVWLMRSLGLVTELGDVLVEALASEQTTPREAATLVAAMGTTECSQSRDVQVVLDGALLGALGYDDARVRSNAIEAIVRRRRRVRASGVSGVSEILMPCSSDGQVPRESLAHSIVELKEDPHHRVRATLWRAMITGELIDVWAGAASVRTVADSAITADHATEVRGGTTEAKPNGEASIKDAYGALTTMLTSTTAMDRLAGTWAAGRIVLREGNQSLAGRGVRARLVSLGAHDSQAQTQVLQAKLAELARFDTEPKVRWRAACVIERVEGDLRARWSRRDGMEASERFTHFAHQEAAQ